MVAGFVVDRGSWVPGIVVVMLVRQEPREAFVCLRQQYPVVLRCGEGLPRQSSAVAPLTVSSSPLLLPAPALSCGAEAALPLA